MSDETASRQKGRNDRRGRLFFLACLILITLGRFYLLRSEDIIMGSSGYDDYLLVQLGQGAFWWRPPDEKSFIKLPVYPLWIWLCHKTGIPLYDGTNLLAIAVSLFLVYALRKLDLPRFACVVVYAALLFETTTIDTLRRVVSNNFYGILLIAIFAWMALALTASRDRRLWILSGGLAVFLGLFAITHAELVLAWVIFASFLAAVILRHLLSTDRKRLTKPVLSVCLFPALALIGAPLLVAVANKIVFDVFASCSLTSPGFSAAINNLLAIKPDKDIPYVPVTKNARRKAYAVSPAFAKLKPYLESAKGTHWGRHAARLYHVHAEEVGGGWFFFALRSAIASKTEARTPAEHEAYYRKIADELKQAFEEGKIPKRRVWISLVQPDPTIWERLPASVGRIFRAAISPRPPGSILTVANRSRWIPVIEEAFDRVTYRKSRHRIATVKVSGWGFSNGRTIDSILLSRRGGSSLPVTFESFPLPALFGANKDQYPSLRPDAPFGFKATVPVRGSERAGATMEFGFRDGIKQRVPLADLRSRKFALGGEGAQQTGWLQIDSVTDVRPDRADLNQPTQGIAKVAKAYSATLKLLLFALVPSLIVLGIFRNSPAHNYRLYLWTLPLIGFITARVALLALIDASSFDGTKTRYVSAVAVPLVIVAIVLNAQAIMVLCTRFHRERVST